MLDAATISDIRRLLAQGCKQRALARVLGLARVTVMSVAHNMRPCYDRVMARQQKREYDDDQPVHCPGCGTRQLLPCIICAARAARDERLQRARAVLAKFRECVLHEPTYALGFDLRGEDLRRLEEVRAARAASAPSPKLDRSTAQQSIADAVFISDDEAA